MRLDAHLDQGRRRHAAERRVRVDDGFDGVLAVRARRQSSGTVKDGHAGDYPTQ